jgi:hypothetical protein
VTVPSSSAFKVAVLGRPRGLHVGYISNIHISETVLRKRKEKKRLQYCIGPYIHPDHMFLKNKTWPRGMRAPLLVY